MNFQQFRQSIVKNRAKLVIEGVKPKWPYNYGTRPAYVVTMNSTSIYFYFNDDGILLDKKKI